MIDRLRRPALALLLGLAACASLPKTFERTPSVAIPAGGTTRLGRLFAPARALHPGDSGFFVLDNGRQSATARMALVDAAQSSIDVQSYAWAGDTLGGVFWDRLCRAAERGVRVRALVDDMTLGGRNLRALAHCRVEVRIFNPFARRKLGRVLELVRRFGTLNHRMHNKLLVVDGEVAVFGGRNLTDEYFGLHADYDFRDLDLLTVGSVVAEGARAFDLFWNSDFSYPTTAFARGAPDAKAMQRMRDAIARAYSRYPYPLDLDAERLFTEVGEAMAWGRGEVFYDLPSKAAGAGGEGPPERELERLATAARERVTIAAAYFVPKKDAPILRALRGRGVAVRVLTNSLESTDLIPVHAVYAKSRPSVVQAGVEMHELRPDAAVRAIHLADPRSRARLGLHAKLAVFDRETVFVGSFNLDPRSRYLNTEIVVVAHAPELARRVEQALEPDFAIESSWRVEPGRRGDVSWVERTANGLHRSGFEPAGFTRSLRCFIFMLLPIRNQI